MDERKKLKKNKMLKFKGNFEKFKEIIMIKASY